MVINGTSPRSASICAESVMVLVCAPTSTETLAWVIRRRVTLAAVAGSSLVVSAGRISSLAPPKDLMPPCAFTLSAATCSPAATLRPPSPNPPVMEFGAPMRTDAGVPCAVARPAMPNSGKVAALPIRLRRLKVMVGVLPEGRARRCPRALLGSPKPSQRRRQYNRLAGPMPRRHHSADSAPASAPCPVRGLSPTRPAR